MKYQFMRFPGGKAKAVTFSYDDGVRADLRLIETMNRYSIKGTFNLAGWVLNAQPGGNRLTVEEVQKYILDAGHEVAVHGMEHRAPGILRAAQGIREVLSCRVELEKAFGRIIRGMAYPDTGIGRLTSGVDYATIRKYLQDLDIVYARTLAGDNKNFMMPEDWYAWMPSVRHANPEALEYAKAFVQLQIPTYVAAQYPRLFYLWGHSYEFDDNNNWELLDQLCAELGNRDDIWYATNMEIYEYTQAYNSLIYSADGTRIYNPTLYRIWFVQHGVPYSIASGETLVMQD